MSQPLVAAVMLCSRGREQMGLRAAESFALQTYENKILAMFDTSTWDGTIGGMRNRAAETLIGHDILIHFDDDDWSSPRRIAEQVELLQSSGADVVGYNEMLFSDERSSQARNREAWLYRNTDPRYALGTSLCYWSKAWERSPFEAIDEGEDWRFTSRLKCVGVSSLVGVHENIACYSGISTGVPKILPHQTRMVARIHAGNTSKAYRAEAMNKSGEWSRVPAWDEYVGGVFK
jgi:hypothetical protein